MGYSFRLTARVLLYAPSHRQDSTYHSRGRIDPTTHRTMSKRSYHSIMKPLHALWILGVFDKLKVKTDVETSRADRFDQRYA